MNDSNVNTARKPSGLKPPSKIARPTNIVLEKPVEKGAGDASSSVIDDGENFIVGDRVWVGGTKPGVVAFIGETQFGPGDWAGVVLDEPIGKNDGSVANIRYFQCAPNRGIFARPSRLTTFPTNSGSNSCRTPAPPVTPERIRPSSTTSPTSSIASSRLRTPLSHSFSGNQDVKVGDRVIVQSSHGSKAGMLRYFGTTEFGSGLWCGVELDDPVGKNDGSVAGVSYFDCAPKFGLFVPAEKVSRSPISKKGGPPCVVHPEGIKRQGTRESLRSTSTIQTSATSNLRTNRNPLSKTLGSSFTSAPRSPFQDQVKEKDVYIQQLLKERELERAQITTAATQAEEAEKKLAALKKEYEQIFAEHEIQNTNLSQTIEKLEKEKTTLLQQLEDNKKKLEDIQFNLEEESITKSEIQALNEEYVEKLKNFERVVSSAHASLEYDAQSSGIFTTEGGSEKGSSPGAQPPSLQADQNEINEELISSRKMIHVLTEKTSELENECQQLRESIEKLKLVDRSKDEMINTLRHELTSHQQNNIGGDLSSSATHDLKSKLAKMEDENDCLKEKLSKATEKLLAFESSLSQKNEELNKINAILETEGKETDARMEKLRNDLQFEIDENKVKIEEMTSKMDELSALLVAKEKESAALAECIARLCDGIDERNTIVSRVILDTEDAADNITRAISAATKLRLKECALPLIEECDQLPKEKIQSLLDRFEQSNENNIVLLKKLETLAEVISRKDALLEESTEEKERMRKEFQTSIELKMRELKQMDQKYADLEKVKIEIETRLKESEGYVKNLEQSSRSTESELKERLAKVQRDLETKEDEWEETIRVIKHLRDESQLKESKNSVERENYEKEIRDLKSEIERVNATLNTVVEEKKKLCNEYVELRKLSEFTIKTLAGETQESIENIDPVLAEDDHTAYVQAFEKNVRAHEEELKNMKTTIENLNTSISDGHQKITTLEGVCEKHRDEKRDLEKTRDEVRAELMTASKQIESLDLEKDKMSQKIAVLENDCKQYKDEREILKKEKEQLREDMQMATVTLEAQKMQFADSESETETLKQKLIENNMREAQLKDLREEFKRLEESLKKSEDTRNSLQLNLEAVCQERAEMQSKLDIAHEEKDSLSRKIDEHRAEMKVFEEKFTKREKELQEMCETSQTLQNSLQELENVKNKLESDLQSVTEESIRLKNELGTTCEERDGALKTLFQFSEKSAILDGNLRKQETETFGIREELDTLKSSFVTLELEKNELQSKLGFINEENTRMKNLLNASDEEKEQLARRTEKISSDSQVLTGEIAEREREIEELKKCLENLQNDKDKFESQLEDAVRENTQLKEQQSVFNVEKEDLIKRNEQFSSDSKLINDKVAEKERELTEIRTVHIDLQSASDTLKTSVNKLESELKEVNDENISIRNQLTIIAEEKNNLVKKLEENVKASTSINEEITCREQRLQDMQKEFLALKDKSERTMEELTQSQTVNCVLEQTNASLSAELNSTKERLNRLENTEKESDRRRQQLEEKVKSLSQANDDTNTKEKKTQETNNRLMAELSSKLQILQQELESKERSYRQELAEVDKNIQKFTLEKENLSTQLESAKSEIIKLTTCNGRAENDSQNRDTLISNNNLNNNALSSRDTASEEYSKLVEDKIVVENQVQFLNSVIVDMQRKNETLLDRVQYLENIIPPDLLKPKKVIAPRLFCDICDVFDLHDTEDCPVQCGSSSPTPVRRETTKVKPPPRPYCEGCEVFGHTREECNEEETF